MLWLLNLGFAGGESDQAHAKRSIFVKSRNRTVYAGLHDRMRTFYADEDAKIKVNVDWSGFLGDSTIASVAWEIDDQTSNNLTVSDTSNSSTVATAYLSGSKYDREHYVKCLITTNDAIPRKEAETFIVKIVRTAT